MVEAGCWTPSSLGTVSRWEPVSSPEPCWSLFAGRHVQACAEEAVPRAWPGTLPSMPPSTPPRLSQVPSAEALPPGRAAGLGLRAAWAILGEDRFSRGLRDGTSAL